MNATLLIARRLNQPVTIEQAICDFRGLYDLTDKDISINALRVRYYTMVHEMRA